MSVRVNWIKLTHLPTGEYGKVDGWSLRDYAKSLDSMRKIAMDILRSRMCAERSSKLVATYELPDDVPYPMDLREYRTEEKRR